MGWAGGGPISYYTSLKISTPPVLLSPFSYPCLHPTHSLPGPGAALEAGDLFCLWLLFRLLCFSFKRLWDLSTPVVWTAQDECLEHWVSCHHPPPKPQPGGIHRQALVSFFSSPLMPITMKIVGNNGWGCCSLVTETYFCAVVMDSIRITLIKIF